jgi:hypothetical protein
LAASASSVRAAIDEELGNFGVHAFEVGEGVKELRLSAHAVAVDVSAGIDISPPFLSQLP